MKKIVSVSSRQFFKGIGSPYDLDSGLFEKAEGIDLMRYLGLLAAGYIATDLDSGGSVVTDKILWFLPNPTSGNCYAYGNTGNIYKIIMSSDAVSLLQATSNSEGQGAEIYKDYVIYAQDTQVGKYGPLSGSPTFDDDGICVAASLTDGSYHPIAIGADGKCYVADVNELNSFSLIDGPPSSDWAASAFILPTDHTIVAHLNDGRYQVIGATRFPTGSVGAREIKIFYWDYLDANTWIKEYVIPEADLFGLKKMGDWIYAFTRWGVYRFNFNYSPELVITEGSGITNLYCEAKHGAIDEWKGHLLWGSFNGWAYGPPRKGWPSFLSNPLRIAAGDNADAEIYGLRVITITKIYVGAGSGDTNKLYAFKTSNSSTTTNTVLLDLGRPWEVKQIKITMQTAGSVTVSITDADATAIITGTLTATGKITAEGTASKIAEHIIITLTINSGARIKRIDVFGDPLPEYV